MNLKIIVEYNINSRQEIEKLLRSFYKKVRVPPGLVAEEIISFVDLLTKLGEDKSNQRYKAFILKVFRDDELVSLWPLMEYHKKKFGFIWIKSIVFLGQNFSQKFCDIIQDKISCKEIEQVLSFLKSNFKHHYLCLENLPDPSILLKCQKDKCYLFAGQVEIPVNFSYENIKRTIYSGSLRSNLKKYKNFINKPGNKITHGITKDHKEILGHYDDFKKISGQKSSEIGFKSIYENEITGKWYVNTVLKKQNHFLCYYKYKDVTVSYVLGHIKSNVIYLLDGGYNRDIKFGKSISFGALAIDKVVEGFAEKAEYIDLGFGLNPYKLSFSKQLKKVWTFVDTGKTPFAKLIYYNYLRKVKSVHYKTSKDFNKLKD